MTTIFDEESDDASNARFEAETAEVDVPITEAPQPGAAQPDDEGIPLEGLVTPYVCGLLLSIPGAIRAKQTGLEFWRLDEEEINLLGAASQPLFVYLVRKYLGEGVGMFAATAVALAAVYSPRMIQEQQLKRKQRGEGGPVYPNDPRNKRTSSTGPLPTSPVESAPSSGNEAAARASNRDSFSVNFQE
jgi:hypothetical protein